ncbi:uncharacterized protein [Parasteatoda tepidariorum]|uniref:uncharacterized protein n=1 Tax=Parasteatoda tepidariorum TaxID=114398 RepID=UPI0039BCB827
MYGMTSATFFSTRTLRQLVIDEQENYPDASRATLCHFYIDDLLSRSATKEGATQLVSELQAMMKRGGFSLCKWVSNDPDALANISEELKTVDSKHMINDDQPVKILGIAWLPDVDKFTFTIFLNESDVWTKRKVLSKVAKIFDPLGWLAPTVITSKIFLQELWSHHLGWDEELPDSLARQWRATDVQVHGFCDTSEKAYCAAIYICSKDSNQAVTSRLLTSKTRVSPNKLKRVVAYCLRFVKNCSVAADKRNKSFLTTNEAEKRIVKFIQQDHFPTEVSYLSTGKQLPSNNKLVLLTPFYDDSGIIHVGGRRKTSMLPKSKKHPILLPKTNHVVNLLITDYHLKLLHAGPQLLQTALREKFWILLARDAVRRVVRTCIPCFRNRPWLTERIMGDLPEFRACPSSIFQ